jgi:hypothetical protein
MDNNHVLLKTHSEKIDHFFKRYECGEKDYLLEALRLCCVSEEQKLTDWVAREVVIAIDKWDRSKVRTLDEAFDVERPKGYSQKAAEKKRALQNIVFVEVTNLRRDQPVDDFLFETVGNEHGIGITQAKYYYYDKKKEIDPILESLNLKLSKKK